MNNQVWNLYKNSREGKKVIDLFEYNPENVYDNIEKLVSYASKWGCDIAPKKYCQWFEIFEANFNEHGVWQGDLTRDSFAQFVNDFEILEPYFDSDGTIKFYDDKKAVFIAKNKYRDKARCVTFLSLCLYYNTDFFKPILVPSDFAQFQRNCDVIGLELPPVPHTKDYKEYLLFYYDICEVIKEFQTANGMDDDEICACIYDFAPMLIEEKASTPIPTPTNVWMTGASKEDFELLDNLGYGNDPNNPNHVWACNERTRRGDIVIIYCLSPRSFIHSIWRANSNGTFNPFDTYQCRTTLCDPIKVPEITINDLKSDQYLSQIPIVRKNLQGVNGVELMAQDYLELLRLIEQKGCDIIQLPRLFEGDSMQFGIIEIEKDVEEKILIPALEKLGYSPSDWTRQLSLKAGRNTKAIPDFVFFPQGERHFESAPMVIEAKYDMSSMIEMHKAYAQSLSYARMLRAKIFGICDKERLILYELDNSGLSDRNNPVYENHWSTVFSNELEGAKLKQIIGKEVILASM